MDYVHVTIHVFNNSKAALALTIIRYVGKEEDIMTLRCCHNAKHKDRILPLFAKPNEPPRCFNCIPWGNFDISKNYTRIGKVVAQ